MVLFKAIRTASSPDIASEINGRADIVHTELLSAHLNLTEFSAANTMICSFFTWFYRLFFIHEEKAFIKDDTKKRELQF
jgi:hypothetical protein